MTEIYLLAFGSVLLVSLLSLIGAFTISMNVARLRAMLFVLVSLAAGALLGDAFLHLIPESLAELGDPTTVALAVIGGILGFFIIEKVLHWHHHQGIESIEPAVHPVGRIILVSDGMHNFIDGLIIGLAYTISIEVGIATTIAVILHEIPQEIGDFGVLMHAGYSRAKALLFNFLSGLLAILGAGVAFVLGTTVESFAMFLVPIAAGGFIYVALSDLIPELHKTTSARKSAIQLVAILAGIGAMFLLLSFEGHGHGHGHGHGTELHLETEDHAHEHGGEHGHEHADEHAGEHAGEHADEHPADTHAH